MNKCCEKTFIDALEEVLILIDERKIEHIHHLVPVIKKAINLLKEKESE
jgi:hypothetical protein